MIPPVPDPESPLGVDEPLTGSASASHCGGCVDHPGCRPQYFAGDGSPTVSMTSKPAGNEPRMRTMLSGLMWMTWPAGRVDRGVDGGLCAGAEHAAATSTAGKMNQRRRTPVDTTDRFGHSGTFVPYRAMYSVSAQLLKKEGGGAMRIAAMRMAVIRTAATLATLAAAGLGVLASSATASADV